MKQTDIVTKTPVRLAYARRLAVAAASVFTAAVFVGCVAAGAKALPAGPDAGDMKLSSFYRWDAELDGQPGDLLRQEPLPESADTVNAGESLRILYISEDVRWHSGAIPVSGSVFLPAGTPPPGGWPLLAWGHGTLGIADVCAPSWTGLKARDAGYVGKWLDAGFAVVATDYQGLGGPGPHPYLYWQAEGRSMLDSIRAAHQARPDELSGQVLLAGQSQGGGAALGAALVAADYAPELGLLGVVATGANSTYPDGPVVLPPRNSANMFLSIISGGLRDGAPPVEELLNEKGLQLLEKARGACTQDIGKLARTLEATELELGLSVSLEELAEYRIPVTDRPQRTMSIPHLIATGMADDTVSPYRQYAVAAALCASGNDVTWATFEGADHDRVLDASFEASLDFARRRLAGERIAGNCAAIQAPEEE